MKKPESYNVIPFINEYNHLAIKDLDDVLESLNDMGYLSEKGKLFKHALWNMFIKNIK